MGMKMEDIGTMAAFARGEAARAVGAEAMVFDWNKASRLIAERSPRAAVAGLRGDMGATSGVIWRDGKKIVDEYTYLSSTWAVPILVLDGEETPCWRYAKDTPGWGSHTKWPETNPHAAEPQE